MLLQEFLQAPGREVLATARDLDVRPSKLGALLESGIVSGRDERIEMSDRVVETAGLHLERGQVAERLLADHGGRFRIAREPAEPGLGFRAAATLIKLPRDVEHDLEIPGLGRF